jgi:hypothetical protein
MKTKGSNLQDFNPKNKNKKNPNCQIFMISSTKVCKEYRGILVWRIASPPNLTIKKKKNPI